MMVVGAVTAWCCAAAVLDAPLKLRDAYATMWRIVTCKTLGVFADFNGRVWDQRNEIYLANCIAPPHRTRVGLCSRLFVASPQREKQ